MPYEKHVKTRFQCPTNNSRAKALEKKRRESKQYYQKNRERILVRNKKYYEEHKVETSARGKAFHHLSIKDKCVLCGTTENLERHHPDYNKPMEVVTLCRSCHLKHHYEVDERKPPIRHSTAEKLYPRVSFRLAPSTLDRLDSLAKKLRLPRSVLLRTFTIEGLNKKRR